MKTLFTFAICLLLFSLSTMAGRPPEAVARAFKLKFPTASHVKWGKENPSEWEANFVMAGINSSANFSTDGSWLETEKEVPLNQLPEAVVIAIKKAGKNNQIIGASMIESLKDGILYEADVKSRIRKKEVIYRVDGSLLK
ncbi:MAG: PepSY-like domain-containing protein [Bacteroidetes bacterium]|nr:PepSY-like domain-containing protein [Bacteroidota bacterium]